MLMEFYAPASGWWLILGKVGEERDEGIDPLMSCYFLDFLESLKCPPI